MNNKAKFIQALSPYKNKSVNKTKVDPWNTEDLNIKAEYSIKTRKKNLKFMTPILKLKSTFTKEIIQEISVNTSESDLKTLSNDKGEEEDTKKDILPLLLLPKAKNRTKCLFADILSCDYGSKNAKRTENFKFPKLNFCSFELNSNFKAKKDNFNSLSCLEVKEYEKRKNFKIKINKLER